MQLKKVQKLTYINNKFDVNLSKVTFLLPIKERPHVTLRLVNYLIKIDYKLKLIVADGSKFNQKSFFKPLIKKHDLIYLKYPYDKDINLYVNKIYFSSKKITTKYCCFMESDEMINFKNINILIKFLDKNQDYVFAKGRIRNFNVSKDFKNLNILNVLYPNKLENNFLHSKTIKKISCWEGLHRTEIFKKIFLIMKNNKINDINTFDDYLRIITQFSGRTKTFKNILYSFRQANTHEFDLDMSIGANAKIRLFRPTIFFDLIVFLKLAKEEYQKNLKKIDIINSLIIFFLKQRVLKIFRVFFKYFIIKFYSKVLEKKLQKKTNIPINFDEKVFLSRYKKFLTFNRYIRNLCLNK